MSLYFKSLKLASNFPNNISNASGDKTGYKSKWGEIIMPFYMIEINENLSRFIDIEADDEESALKIARKKYKNEEIVLDSDDYVDTTFTVQ